MSTDPNIILEVISPGHGMLLDLGGGKGILRQPIEKLGYSYINIDIKQFEKGEPSLIGDAHNLPFKDCSFNLVISKDTMEHFLQPWSVVKEVHRVLKLNGIFVILVPFMHPFHQDDFYRYSPLGLRNLLCDFEIVLFQSPLWVFTVVGLAFSEVFKRLHLGFMAQPIRHLCRWIDHFFMRNRKHPASFANSYLIVARKENQ